MRSEKFKKGDFAVTKVMLDLQSKGYGIFIPVGEQWPFDLVVYKESEHKFMRLQVKYLGYRKKEFSGKVKYGKDSFDYYAGYIPELDVIVYPSIKFSGRSVTIKVPKSGNNFFWYEDFLDFTDEAKYKTCKDFGLKGTRQSSSAVLKLRKVVRPSKEELEKMVWEKTCTQIAKQFAVSDNAVAKWCKRYDIVKPGRGYWQKLLQSK